MTDLQGADDEPGQKDLNAFCEAAGAGGNDYELHASWSSLGAKIVSKPESKPWHLHEFTAADLDGNQFRVFYDFAWELPDRGGRKDDTSEREAARAKS